jgi:hypothetical protein
LQIVRREASEIEMMPEIFNVKTVAYKGSVYLLREDVAKFLREIAATEENDVRVRLEKAADNVASVKVSKS